MSKWLLWKTSVFRCSWSRIEIRSKYRTLEATHFILKPQPVHSTAHSVVVRQLLDGACWRNTDWGQIGGDYYSTGHDVAAKRPKLPRTYRRLPQRDICRRCIWSRLHAPSWESQPESRDVGIKSEFLTQIPRLSDLSSIWKSAASSSQHSLLSHILNCTQHRAELRVNSRQSEHPTLPEEYVSHSSGRVCQCHRKSVLFLKGNWLCETEFSFFALMCHNYYFFQDWITTKFWSY